MFKQNHNTVLYAKPLQAARSELTDLRQQLVSAVSSSLGELRGQIASEARAIAGLPICENVPQALRAYIKVWGCLHGLLLQPLLAAPQPFPGMRTRAAPHKRPACCRHAYLREHHSV